MSEGPAIAVVTSPRLSDRALLDAWEDGASRAPAVRALAVLARAVGEEAGALGRWPLGRRDAALLDVHAGTFGAALDAVTACPACHEPLEVALRVDELRAGFSEPGEEHELRAHGHRVVFRAVSAEDAAVAAGADPDDAPGLLLDRCVTSAVDDGGEEVGAGELPAAVLDALDRAMAEHDPQADLRLSLTCPECGDRWQTEVDIGDFVWRRVDARARGVLADVAALAAAYGWEEGCILAMSPARRALYLDLAGA